jgi:hypothetical protein
MAAAGRARWKIENEAFNTLKTKGYNLEHNFGHSQQHVSSVLATLNLLAFACHTVCDLADKPWRAARRELVTRQRFFHTMVALTLALPLAATKRKHGVPASNRLNWHPTKETRPARGGTPWSNLYPNTRTLSSARCPASTGLCFAARYGCWPAAPG